MIKKEHKLTGKAKLVGQTLYLKVELPELVSVKSEIPKEAIDKLQGAVLSLVRVALSSDAKIKFLVVSAVVSKWRLNVQIIQMLDDIKGFLYQKISKNDYEERMILDIDSDIDKTKEEFKAFNDSQEYKELTMREFISKLIVSQVNMLLRNNPFIAVALNNPQLKLFEISTDGKELKININHNLKPAIFPIFEEIVNEHSDKITKKYKSWSPTKITLINPNN